MTATETQFLRSEIEYLRFHAEQARKTAPEGAVLPMKGEPERETWFYLNVAANRLENRLRQIGGAA